MRRSKQSTNLASISSSNLMELPVVLPPVQEQQTLLEGVSREVSNVDLLRASVDRSIVLLQERRTALITAAVTGMIDVRDLLDAEAVAA